MRREAAGDVVARAREGDQEAWAALFTRHAPRLVAWLRTMPSGDVSHTAEDVAAEAWLVVAAKIGGFVGDEHGFARWLFHIGYQVSASRRRTAARRRTFPLAVEATTEELWGSTVDPGSDGDGLRSTWRLLGRLSEREAQVVLCLYVMGLDVATTARVLEMSGGAVRVAHHRGLRRLREQLLPLPAPDVTDLRGGDMAEATLPHHLIGDVS